MKKNILYWIGIIFVMGIIGIGVNASTTNSAKKMLPIYCVKTEEKKVALSFDAAWGAEDIDTILDLLKKHNVKVTFFLVGDWVKKYPEAVKRIASEGHDIGNHSNKHPHVSKMSKEAVKADIMGAHEAIKGVTGIDAFLYRGPYGEYNNTVLEAARELGYYTIQWDVDSLDWKNYGVEAIIKTVTEHKHLGNGSIVLLHNGAKYTCQALEAVIIGLKNKGYTLVPVSELILRENYQMNHEGRQIPNIH